MLAAATESQLQLDQIWTLKEQLGQAEEDLKTARGNAKEMQRALTGAELARGAAEAHASAMDIMLQLKKEEAHGLGKLLQRADEEIIKLRTAQIVRTDIGNIYHVYFL